MQSYDHRVQYTPQRYSSVQATPSRPPQVPPRPRHASFAAPESSLPPSLRMPQPSIPASLTPGRLRTARSTWDAPFSPPSRASPSGFSHPSPASRMTLYGDYFSQPQPQPQPPPLPPPPPLPQKPHVPVNLRPPIPPKPSALISPAQPRNPLYPQSIPTSIAFGLPPWSSEFQSPIDDDKDFPPPLALSASDIKPHEDDLAAQEEEELARALDESRLLANVFDDQPSITNIAQKSLASTMAIPADGESWLNMNTPSTAQHSLDSLLDEASLQKQPDDNKSLTHNINGRPLDEHLRSAATESRDTQPTPADSTPAPSLYSNAVSNLLAKSTSNVTVTSNISAMHAPRPPASPAPSSLTHPPSEPPVSPQLTAETYPTSPSIPSISGQSSNFTSDSSVSVGKFYTGDVLTLTASRSPVTSASSSLSLDSSISPSFLEGEDDTDPPKRPGVPYYSANQYVEPELLMGVSLGFSHPVISTFLTPMKEQMPNVITLPYGKPPPCFLQAPSWRRLLKLMARLSATRIEPTVEALTIAKHELRLRTVIQFVRVHHSSSDWRTVLYFTTDMPVAPSVQNSYKYTNGDVGVLPFSYTLSPLPTLLKDGAESQMAKYYVIPSTPMTPYPTLPINFPDLAMYLQSAVEDSRRAAIDGSSGMRKLAQFVDSCYPNDAGMAALDGEAPKKGVGEMLKRVMGRSKGKGSRGNEEIYDLVTPFVSEEWG